MKIRKILSAILGIAAAVLVICAVWMHQDWGWLKFSLTALVVAFAAIMLAESAGDQRRL